MGKLFNSSTFMGVSAKERVYGINKKNFEVSVIDLPLHAEKAKAEKNTNGTGGDEIVCVALSKNGQYLVVITQNKRLLVWEIPSWSLVKEEVLVKRPVAVLFHPISSRVIVADKNGDVYDFSVKEDPFQRELPDLRQITEKDEESQAEALLGHLSMLLDLAITEDGKFLITCDRDEKIRVSSYPNCYNIHTFCLGHEEFVSQISIVPNQLDRLVSTSGDGTVKLWSYMDGKCLATLDVRIKVEDILGQHLKEAAEKEDFDIQTTFTTNLRSFSREKGECIIGISLYRLPVLLFYEVKHASFRYMFSLTTSAPVLDFIFLDDGEIFMFMETSKNDLPNPLALFRFIDDYTAVAEVDDHCLLKLGVDYKSEFKGLSVLTVDADSLYKHKYDNVGDYQKKKQERLSGSQTILPQKRRISE